uniref:Uncharacterized protein n=1 Tax=Daucus carota subsp. sativus TaxID=79200 RepID=A0A161XWU3_DAUCS
MAGDEDNSWRLFTSEDMIQGYKRLKRRKTARTREKVTRRTNSHYATETSIVDNLERDSGAVDMDESPMSAVSYLQDTFQSLQNNNESSKVQDSEIFMTVASNMVNGFLTPMCTPSSVKETCTTNSCKTSLGEHNRPLRTPFADITNTLDRNVAHTSKGRVKEKSKAASLESRNSRDKGKAKEFLTSTHDAGTTNSCKTSLGEHNRPLRTTFADITNTLDRNVAHTRKGRVKEKSKAASLESRNSREKGRAKESNWEHAPLKDWSRNLFAEEFSTNKSTNSVLYDEDLEETRFEAAYFSDDSSSDLDSADADPYVDDEFEDESEVETDSGMSSPLLNKFYF